VLNTQSFKKVDRLWDEVSVELKEAVAEKGSEIFGHLFCFLKAGAKTVSKRCDIRNVVVLIDLGLILHEFLEFSVLVLV